MNNNNTTELTLTLKEEFLVNFIPTIQRMIQKEKDHYEYLCQHEGYPMIEAFKQRSKKDLEHLTQRLAEYIQYAEQLP